MKKTLLFKSALSVGMAIAYAAVSSLSVEPPIFEPPIPNIFVVLFALFLVIQAAVAVDVNRQVDVSAFMFAVYAGAGAVGFFLTTSPTIQFAAFVGALAVFSAVFAVLAALDDVAKYNRLNLATSALFIVHNLHWIGAVGITSFFVGIAYSGSMFIAAIVAAVGLPLILLGYEIGCQMWRKRSACTNDVQETSAEC